LGGNVTDIKFRHLLTHATGWGQLWNKLDKKKRADWNNGWDGLKYVVSLDTVPGSLYSYKNANTALLRILIPQIWVQMGGAPFSQVTADNHDLMYLNYVQNNIFDPIGIYKVVVTGTRPVGSSGMRSISRVINRSQLKFRSS
jgi:hypothetical protein